MGRCDRILHDFTRIQQDWYLPYPIDANPLSKLKLPKEIRAILVRRGFRSLEVAQEFLNPSELPDPYLHFKSLKKTISRIERAISDKEKIAICGDYDADGITSTTVMIKALSKMNSTAQACIPSRFKEGYGLNPNMVENLEKENTKLIITVDNGINAKEALKLAKKKSIDVIITDHHKIPDKLPEAFSIIHPDLTPENSPYRYIAGVGLAYIIGKELIKGLGNIQFIQELEDLLCIGTIADMAPMRGANLYWLKKYLKNLIRTDNIGLQCIYKLSGVGNQEITSEDIGFKIAPRINAVGRLYDPSLVINLLLEDEIGTAMQIARKCDELNRNRKILVEGIEAEASAILESGNSNLPSFIILAQNHWHQGVVGIVASRLVNKYNRPSAVLAGLDNGYYSASVRSAQGLSIIDLLNDCSDLLEKYGGHMYAGGFTIKAENLGRLQDRVYESLKGWSAKRTFNKEIRPEANLQLSEINESFWKNLKLIEPYGNENPKPLFWARACSIKNIKLLKGSHLNLIITQNDTEIKAIMWNNTAINIKSGQVDIAFHILRNTWKGSINYELELVSIRPHMTIEKMIKGDRIYEVQVKNTNEIYIKNSNGTIIKGVYEDSGKITTDKYQENNYIKALFIEASTLYGLSP